jgi:hypothetical protein
MVLIGQNTYQCSGVLEEIKIANEESIPVFGIYQRGVNYYVPDGLGQRFYEWTWPNITAIVNQLNSFLPTPNI